MPHMPFHTFNPLKLPGLVGEELEDFVDLGVESWLLGVPLTDHETTKETEVIKTQNNQIVSKHSAHAQHSPPNASFKAQSRWQISKKKK